MDLQEHMDSKEDVMSIRTRPAAVAAAVVALAASAAGCGGDDTEAASRPLACARPDASVALAVGVRSNNPGFALSDGVKGLLNGSAKARKKITLIRLDGSPAQVFSEAFTSRAGNERAREADLDRYQARFNQALTTGARARVPEADVLGALTLAGRSAGPGGNVVIVDSGLQTTSPLDFRDGLLEAEPDDVVAYLKRSEQLPDLSGRRVILSGIGFTAPPQPRLDNRGQSRTAAIWKKIAEAAGAACVVEDDNPSTEAAPPGLPKVSPVAPPEPTRFSSCGRTDLGEKDDLGFVQGTATFRDPNGARKTLRELAAIVREGGQTVELTGATSSEGSDADNQRLSEERAEAVEQVLVGEGVPADRIDAKGAGEKLPGREDDLGPGGALLPGPAARNRKVVVELHCPTGG